MDQTLLSQHCSFNGVNKVHGQWELQSRRLGQGQRTEPPWLRLRLGVEGHVAASRNHVEPGREPDSPAPTGLLMAWSVVLTRAARVPFRLGVLVENQMPGNSNQGPWKNWHPYAPTLLPGSAHQGWDGLCHFHTESSPSSPCMFWLMESRQSRMEHIFPYTLGPASAAGHSLLGPSAHLFPLQQ
ncbi:unnamed protein product [Lepidochelys kempii]